VTMRSILMRNGQNTTLWTSEPDALAKRRQKLSDRSGWRTERAPDGKKSLFVVILTTHNQRARKRPSAALGPHLGRTSANGLQFSPAANELKQIAGPAGQRGPKLLGFKNFDVIKNIQSNFDQRCDWHLQSLAEASMVKTSIVILGPKTTAG